MTLTYSLPKPLYHFSVLPLSILQHWSPLPWGILCSMSPFPLPNFPPLMIFIPPPHKWYDMCIIPGWCEWRPCIVSVQPDGGPSSSSYKKVSRPIVNIGLVGAMSSNRNKAAIALQLETECWTNSCPIWFLKKSEPKSSSNILVNLFLLCSSRMKINTWKQYSFPCLCLKKVKKQNLKMWEQVNWFEICIKQ